MLYFWYNFFANGFKSEKEEQPMLDGSNAEKSNEPTYRTKIKNEAKMLTATTFASAELEEQQVNWDQ